MRNPNRFTRRNTVGFTLMEVLIVLIIGGVIAVLVLPRIGKLFGRSEVTFESQNVADLIGNIKGLRANGGYGAAGTNLIPQLIVNDGLPDSLTNSAGVVTNSWGGAVTATSTGIGFALTYAAPMPQAACASLATKHSNSQVNSTKINGAAAIVGPVTQAQAAADCAAGTANTIVWTSAN
jgi:prepilin-type N-terminal cleavage/methylation domain-containing protein